jgi:CTP:molybdopterin cytidylyltransferase MocA
VDSAVAADALERVVVVLGARAEEVRAAIDFGRAEPVVCPDWEAGQAASLRCGLRALQGAERVVVTLGDQPWVSTEAIMRLSREPSGTRAAYDGVPGHPVVLGGELAAAAAALDGDEGARGLLRGARTVECGDVADNRDVDTVGDLKEMLR